MYLCVFVTRFSHVFNSLSPRNGSRYPQNVTKMFQICREQCFAFGSMALSNVYPAMSDTEGLNQGAELQHDKLKENVTMAQCDQQEAKGKKKHQLYASAAAYNFFKCSLNIRFIFLPECYLHLNHTPAPGKQKNLYRNEIIDVCLVLKFHPCVFIAAIPNVLV